MTGIGLALLAAAGFVGTSLAALAGRHIGARTRGATLAVAAALLLVLAIGDLYPTGRQGAGRAALPAFVAGFVLLYLIESATHAHTHHAAAEPPAPHALRPFVLGLAIHNLADGFVLGIATRGGGGTGVAVSLGVLVHQVPVGLSLAAVLAASHPPPRQVVRTVALLGLAIPLPTLGAVLLPRQGALVSGVLTALVAGILTYIGASHLLPEAQNEAGGWLVPTVFTSTAVVMVVLLLTLLKG